MLREERARPRAAAPSSVSLNLYRRGRLFAPLSSDLLLFEKKAKKKKKKRTRRRRSEPAAISPEVNFLPDWRSVIVGICITRPTRSSCAPFARRTSRGNWKTRPSRRKMRKRKKKRKVTMERRVEETRRGRGRTEEECGNGPRVKSNLPHLPWAATPPASQQENLLE